MSVYLGTKSRFIFNESAVLFYCNRVFIKKNDSKINRSKVSSIDLHFYFDKYIVEGINGR